MPSFERVMVVDGAELYDVVAFEEGYVAAGCRLADAELAEAGCTEVLVLFSRDGRTWRESEVDGGEDRQVLGLAETPFGLLLFGSTVGSEPPLERVVWRSLDGLHWEPYDIPAPDPIVFAEAHVLEGRAILLGFDTTYDLSDEYAVWTTDGTSSEAGTAPLGAMIVGQRGLVAVGDGCVDVCPEDLPIGTWRSADGLEWVAEAPSMHLDGASIFASGSFGGRAIVGGAGDVGSGEIAMVWFDEPGGWRPVTLEGGAGQTVEDIVDLGEWLGVVTRRDGDASSTTWLSRDGVTWDQAPAKSMPDGFRVRAAGRADPVLLVGYRELWAIDD